jgi:hypothetical protein
MTGRLDLVECTHCRSWFTPDSSEEVFCHATKRCRREPAASQNDHRAETSPAVRRAIIRA